METMGLWWGNNGSFLGEIKKMIGWMALAGCGSLKRKKIKRWREKERKIGIEKGKEN